MLCGEGVVARGGRRAFFFSSRFFSSRAFFELEPCSPAHDRSAARMVSRMNSLAAILLELDWVGLDDTIEFVGKNLGARRRFYTGGEEGAAGIWRGAVPNFQLMRGYTHVKKITLLLLLLLRRPRHAAPRPQRVSARRAATAAATAHTANTNTIHNHTAAAAGRAVAAAASTSTSSSTSTSTATAAARRGAAAALDRRRRPF